MEEEKKKSHEREERAGAQPGGEERREKEERGEKRSGTENREERAGEEAERRPEEGAGARERPPEKERQGTRESGAGARESPGTGRSAKEGGGEGGYNVSCANCGKPFRMDTEPEEGKAVFCENCAESGAKAPSPSGGAK